MDYRVSNKENNCMTPSSPINRISRMVHLISLQSGGELKFHSETCLRLYNSILQAQNAIEFTDRISGFLVPAASPSYTDLRGIQFQSTSVVAALV